MFKETLLNVSDNSGARIVQCIGFFKNIKCNFVGINEIIRVCIKNLNRRKFFTPKGRNKQTKKIRIDKVKEKEKFLYLGIILSCKKPVKRFDGTFVSTKENRVVLLADSWKYLGTRLSGFILKECRKKKKISIYKELISNARNRI